MNHFSRMCCGQVGQKKQVNTLNDCDSDAEVMFTGAISAENKDWVETVSFGKMQELVPSAMSYLKLLMTRSRQNLCNPSQQS